MHNGLKDTQLKEAVLNVTGSMPPADVKKRLEGLDELMGFVQDSSSLNFAEILPGLWFLFVHICTFMPSRMTH